MGVLEAVFWMSVAILLYAQAAYPLLLIAASRLASSGSRRSSVLWPASQRNR